MSFIYLIASDLYLTLLDGGGDGLFTGKGRKLGNTKLLIGYFPLERGREKTKKKEKRKGEKTTPCAEE